MFDTGGVPKETFTLCHAGRRDADRRVVSATAPPELSVASPRGIALMWGPKLQGKAEVST